jgi:hypothetical protein
LAPGTEAPLLPPLPPLPSAFGSAGSMASMSREGQRAARGKGPAAASEKEARSRRSPATNVPSGRVPQRVVAPQTHAWKSSNVLHGLSLGLGV